MKKFSILFFLILFLTACAPKQAVNVTPLKVFYAGENSGVKTALDLAEQAGTVTLVDDMAQAQTLVLNGVIPAGAVERAQAGAGVVLILGKDVTNEQASTLLDQQVTLTAAEDAISLVDAKGVNDALLTEIIWNGSPQIRERFIVNGLNPQSQALVTGYQDSEEVLIQASERMYVLTSALEGEANPQIQEWGYFNYLDLSSRRTRGGRNAAVVCRLSRIACTARR